MVNAFDTATLKCEHGFEGLKGKAKVSFPRECMVGACNAATLITWFISLKVHVWSTILPYVLIPSFLFPAL